MASYTQFIVKIIQEQALIIGPIAWIEARKVPGLVVEDEKNSKLSVTGDGKQVVSSLVSQYEKLFGRASREVCKEAVRDMLPSLSSDEIPDVLK